MIEKLPRNCKGKTQSPTEGRSIGNQAVKGKNIQLFKQMLVKTGCDKVLVSRLPSHRCEIMPRVPQSRNLARWRPPKSHSKSQKDNLNGLRQVAAWLKT